MKLFFDTSDARSKLAKQKLEKLGLNTKELENFLNVKNGDALIFSPAKKWTEQELLNLPEYILLFCGNVDKNFSHILKEKKITHFNFLEDEIFAVKNANLTAEGILALILFNSKKSIFENNVLIFGFGRISKALCILFLKLGVNFSVASFSKNSFDESFLAGNNNFFGFEFLKKLDKFDILINTRPEKFLEKEHLKNVKKDALFFETASVCCLDEKDVENFSYLKSPALPQKFACESASQIVVDKILGELEK